MLLFVLLRTNFLGSQHGYTNGVVKLLFVISEQQLNCLITVLKFHFCCHVTFVSKHHSYFLNLFAFNLLHKSVYMEL